MSQDEISFLSIDHAQEHFLNRRDACSYTLRSWVVIGCRRPDAIRPSLKSDFELEFVLLKLDFL